MIAPNAAGTDAGWNPSPISKVLTCVNTSTPASVPSQRPRPPTSAVPPTTTAAMVWNR